MFVFGFLSFLIILNLQFDRSSAENQTDYCDICEDHTMCLFPDNYPASYCGDIIDALFTESEITAIINGHNEFRRRVASGEENRGNPGPQPAATDMKEMKWDKELAKIAQRWAEQCEEGRDSCRDVGRFHVGQNVASITQRKRDGLPKPLEVMEPWFDEVEWFNRNDVSSYRDNSNTTEYTQLIWAKTTYIGCGWTISSYGGNYYTGTLKCNYGPAGNVEGKPVYKT